MEKLFKQDSVVGGSNFDLGATKMAPMDFGKLYPIYLDLGNPGDRYKFNFRGLVTMNPLIGKLMANIWIKVRYYVVPLRTIDDIRLDNGGTFNWEKFISGGRNGTDSQTLPEWAPTDTSEGSLWDYLGFPTGIDPDGARPNEFPMRAYNKIYNDWYRPKDYIDEIDHDSEDIQYVKYDSGDRFVNLKPWRQRGTAPTLGISGTTYADFTGSTAIVTGTPPQSDPLTASYGTVGNNTIGAVTGGATWKSNVVNALSDNVVDLAGSAQADMNDFRESFAIQRFMELMTKRDVYFYPDFISTLFEIEVSNKAFEVSQYVGGTKEQIMVSEIVNTSSTATEVQGNMSGHGIAGLNGDCGSIQLDDYAVVMGVMYIIPDTQYSQGVNRQWLQATKEDFMNPLFANLGPQGVTLGEIVAKNADSSHNGTLFGYEPRYEEYRKKESTIAGAFRSTLDHMHLGRQFNPASPPTLDETFITAQDVRSADILAVPSEPAFLVNASTLCTCYRRGLPLIPDTGLV